MQVENVGDETVEDVVVTDVYADDMELYGDVRSHWEGSSWVDYADENYFTISLGNLEPNTRADIDYDMFIPESVTLTPGMIFANTASVTPTDGYPDDNSAYFELISEHGPAPHLRVEKWLIGDGSPGEGGNAAFWVQFLNQGDALAENVTITDTMVGMTYLRDSFGGAITGGPGETGITWDVGTLEPGGWIGFVVFAEVTANEGEPVSNTVTISTSNPNDQGGEEEKTAYWGDQVWANDTYLNVGKWPWTGQPAPGQDYVYTINVCNNGSTSSSTLNVLDTLPALTGFVDWWSSDVGWYEVDVAGSPIELAHTCISPGTCSEVYIRVHLDESAEIDAELVNVAEMIGGNDLSDDDNVAEARHSVGGDNPDVSIGQSWHSGVLTPDGEYRYGIYIRNEGNINVDSTQVTATLPDGVDFVGYDHWGLAGLGIPEVVGNTITWQVVNFYPGFDHTIEIWVKINFDTTPGTALVHLVEIEIQDGEVNTDNNESVFEEQVYGHGPNLRIRKWGGWHGWGDGRYAWYHLQAENVGDEPVEWVDVQDVYDTNMSLQNDPGTNFWEWWDWENDGDNHVLTVHLSRLEPGWSIGIDYTLGIPESVTPTPGEVIENTATVMPVDGDTNPDDNSVSIELVYQGVVVDEAPTITSPNFATFIVGQEGSFTVTTTGHPTPTIYETGGFPDGITLTGNGDGTAGLTGTPAEGSESQYVVTIMAENGIEPNAEQTFTLTVATEAGTTDEGGGTLMFEDEALVVDIPPGALEGGTQFIYIQQADPSQDPPGTFSFAGITFQLSAINTQTGDPVTEFTEPLTLKIYYDPAALGDLDEETLQLFFWDTEVPGWVDVAETCSGGEYTRNLDEGWFSVPLCHLSEFAVMGMEAVNVPPVADAGPDQSVQRAALVTLDGSSSYDPDNNVPITYQWTQTGGTTVILSSTVEEQPTFTAPNDLGDLTFTLVVTDFKGSVSSPDEVVISVVNLKPVANAGPDQLVDRSATVTLDGSSSNDEDGDYPLTYLWAQTGGTEVILSSTTTEQPTFTAPGTPGDLIFTLVVTDFLGASSEADEVVITVDNLKPVANAGPVQSVNRMAGVSLDGSGSTDPEGDLPLTYLWEQTSGTGVTLSSTTAEKPTFTAPNTPGVLTFSLVVTDSYGAVSEADEVDITVLNQAPVADAGDDEDVFRLAEVTLDGSGSADPDDDALTYLWSQTSGTTVVLSDVTAQRPTFTAPNVPGALEFSLVVTDSFGAESTADMVKITVLNRAPEAQDQTVQVIEDQSLEITLLATDADFDALTYQYTQPTHGGLSGTAPNLTYTPDEGYTGPDSFTFKANDGYADSNLATVTINVVEFTEPPEITSDDETTFTVGVYGSFTFTATGTPSPGISLAGALPGGLTFTPGTGTANLSGTPAAGSARTYTLTVTANNGVDPNDVQEFTLTVNTPPVAHAGPDKDVYMTALVTLDGSGSSDPDGDLPLTYQWTQTEGTASTLSDATAQKPTFTVPTVPGYLKFSLVVTDALGAVSAADEVVLNVVNRMPVANAGPDQMVTVSSLVTLDGSGSSDPDGDSLAYAWTQTSGETVALTDATAQKPTFTAPAEAGTLTFTLEVTDSYGMSSTQDTVTITVEEAQGPGYLIFLPLINR
jgi:uncharacterized repeat protein (TIGR01451 family)